MAAMRRIRGVIFDIDGTLIDSNDAHARAWVDALAEYGIEVPFERARRMIGMGSDKLLPELAGVEKESTLGREIADRRGEIFKKRYQPTLVAFPGSRDLLLRMRDAGLALAVATSAKGDELHAFLDVAGVADLVEEATSSSDVTRSKPDPDIVAAALDKLGLDPGEVLMVGDTPYDVEAASRAGISAVAVRCGGWSDEDLAGAVAIYDGPADILRRFDESPFAK
jgi:HAD superfamily hydrolase (TIGR01509 family)